MTRIYAIHGNLQTPAAWEGLQAALGLELVTINLWETEAPDFWSWADVLCARVEMEMRGEPVWLLGYSLGGRLALHALLRQPKRWRGALVVGAHPGLRSKSEKAARLSHDQAWGQRFQEKNSCSGAYAQDWDTLLDAWSKQAVFAGRPNPCPPREVDFSRGAVARLFDQFSLGRQDDLRPFLRECYTEASTVYPETEKHRLPRPALHYFSGQDDAKFRTLGDELAAIGPGITHHVIPGAGHRVPWEQPEAFAHAVRSIITSNWTDDFGTIRG